MAPPAPLGWSPRAERETRPLTANADAVVGPAGALPPRPSPQTGRPPTHRTSACVGGGVAVGKGLHREGRAGGTRVSHPGARTAAPPPRALPEPRSRGWACLS